MSMYVSKRFAAPWRITRSPHVSSVTKLVRLASQDENPSSKWKSSAPSGWNTRNNYVTKKVTVLI